MKKILFINPGPFGSLTDTYFYYKYLKEKYDITYLGFDEDKCTRDFEKIKIIHLPGSGNTLINKTRFIKKIYQLTRFYNFDFVLLNYFFGSSIISVFKINNLIVDVRSSIISPSKINRFIKNFILSIEIRFFKRVSCISKSLVDYLHLPTSTHILPLGAPKTPINKKDFKELKILYVGTFHERNIENTIVGFSRFLNKNQEAKSSVYTIIGFGSKNEIDSIKNVIKAEDMQKHIFYKGEVRHPELLNYLNTHNIGISYIPIKSYFDNQPPTKSFEYLLSGMAVIATGTKENKRIITNSNGVVVGDSIEDVYQGLIQIHNNRFQYNSEGIQKEAQKYSWETIINENLIPYIESFHP